MAKLSTVEGVVEVPEGVECQFALNGLSESPLCGSKVRVSERGEFAESEVMMRA